MSAALLLTAGLLGFSDMLHAWQWMHLQLHSTLETFGGITACLISVMLFIRAQEALEVHLMMLATGFASMGVLDIAHAISQPGDAFIFLHSFAGLSGGFFFASVWFSWGRRMRRLSELRLIYVGFILLSMSVGLRALLFPDDVPKIMPLFDGEFTMAAVLINITASLLFIVSVFKFYLMYRKNGDPRDLLFASLAMLFGIAAMIFPFSSLWNGMWWAWHLIRSSAFFVTLVFVFIQYRNHLVSKGMSPKGDDR